MSEFVEFGDFKLVRTTEEEDVVAWVAPCGDVTYFSEYEDAWRVDANIRFHLIMCWDCHS